MGAPDHPSHRLGRRGEDLATAHLVTLGFRILARNLRMPAAEIDVVASDDEGLVFIEVKSRTVAGSRQPYDAVDEDKRDRLGQAALQYIDRNRLGDVDWRIGIVSVLFAQDGRQVGVEWIDEVG